MSQDDLGDLQFAIEEQGYSWEAGETSLSVLQPEEQEQRLGLTLVPEEMDRLAMAFADLSFVPRSRPPGTGAMWKAPIGRRQSGTSRAAAHAWPLARWRC
jgi:hypothetical protein